MYSQKRPPESTPKHIATNVYNSCFYYGSMYGSLIFDEKTLIFDKKMSFLIFHCMHLTVKKKNCIHFGFTMPFQRVLLFFNFIICKVFVWFRLDHTHV